MYCHSHCLRSTTECEVTFSCPRNQGAVLCLPIEAQGKDTVARADFGKWIIRHIDRWFPWARGLGLEINCMEDIILVTGTHRTKSWTNVAFPGGQKDAQASFGVNLNRRRGDIVRLNWQISHERIRGALLNRGPDGEVRFDRRSLCWLMNPELLYLSRDLDCARTCVSSRRISAFSYEGFAPLVGSRYCRLSLRGRRDPIQTRRDPMRSQMQNSCRYLLSRR